MNEFVHLHVHTQYSLLDGAVRFDELFDKCEEYGMPAVAITDHGNMYGALEFVKTAIRHTDPKADPFSFFKEGGKCKVQPIIGCELYMCDNMHEKTTVNGKAPKLNHLILLCKDIVGYKNLIKLVSLSYTEGLYYKPRIDFELLSKHTEGLICLSACIAGQLPQALLHNQMEKADEIVEKYKALFGEDYYIEIQDHNIKDQKVVLPLLISIARKHNVKLVATNDVHYLNKEDAKMQKVLQCISFRQTMSMDEDIDDTQGETVEDDGYFPTKEFYLKSYDEMHKLFPELEEALSVTVEIAKKCTCDFFSKEPLMPPYKPEDGSSAIDFLRGLCYEGLEKKYGEITPAIRERAEYELGIVTRMGFVEYYLIVWDFIHWSETHGVPVGPGRGSGVGSIVAYAIGITKVDPLRYNLLFERFLNPERVSNPDFDVDFCVDGRERTIQYVIGKYGVPNVSQIVTFGTMASKAAIKDVGRVYSIPFAEINAITKTMPPVMGKLHIGHLLGLLPPLKPDDPSPVVPELKEMYETDPTKHKLLDMAMKVEGMPRQTGMHAAGVIICRDPISDHIPMAKSSEGIITTQYNMIECEELGLLKMDFLGLRTVTDIKKAQDIIKKTRGVDIDFYSRTMDYNDPGTYKLISTGDTHAVFQLEGEGMKKFMRDLKPTSLEDIIAGISLYRPGPMDKIGIYVQNKHHPEQIVYDHPLLEPILNVTYGIMVYQEQVMKIVQVLGGYSLGRADIVRRMMSKKKHAAMAKEREVFLHGLHDGKVDICGTLANGVSEEVSNKVFDDMTSFASYAFNKSHAAAYAYLCFQTAYLKNYYTVEFITAILNNRITDIGEITNYLSYLKDVGYEVLPPNINKSYSEFTVENGACRIGMAAIKNVGINAIDQIVEEREKNGEYTDFVQFVKRMGGSGLNKKQLESLIYAGTFDCFNNTRAQLINVYEQILAQADKEKKQEQTGQFSFFDEIKETVDNFVMPDIEEYPLSYKLSKEKEVAGVYLTGHPLQEYTEYLKSFKYNSTMFTSKKEEGEDEETEQLESNLIPDDTLVSVGGMLTEAMKRTSKKSGKDFGIAKLEDLYGTIELMLPGFKLAQYKDVFVNEKLVTVTGRVRNKDGLMSISVDKIEDWSKVEKTIHKKMCIYLAFSQCEESIIDDITSILNAYKGDDEVYIKDNDSNQIYSTGLTTDITSTLLKELYGLVGDGNIKVIEK